MKFVATIAACSLAMTVALASPTLAGPMAAAGDLGPTDHDDLIQNVRIFCYNTHSGRFLHWGRCGGGFPRVYCRSNYTGGFLHWGRC